MTTSATTDPPFLAIPFADGRRLRLFGELDLLTTGTFAAVLETLPEGVDVLDLAELTFMDVSGLHAVERYAGQRPKGSGPLVLENVGGLVGRLFEITGAHMNPDIELRGRDGSRHG